MVCSYLVQALGMSVNEALAAFEQARPPGVKHERFVKELHRRFDNHRWGSGFSTVGSETAGSVGGFSHPRGSHDGSVASMQSDFKGVAEHLQRQQVPSRQAFTLVTGLLNVHRHELSLHAAQITLHCSRMCMPAHPFNAAA